MLHYLQKVTKEIILPNLNNPLNVQRNQLTRWLASALIYVTNQNLQMAEPWKFWVVSTVSGLPQGVPASSMDSLLPVSPSSALQDHWVPAESGDFGLVDRPRHPGDCKQLSGWIPGPQRCQETEALLTFPLPLLQCLQTMLPLWRLAIWYHLFN